MTRSKRSRRSERSRRSRRSKRGGGVVGALFGEIVSPETPDRWQKREELRRKCMLATEHKYSYETLIKKCGRTDDIWNPPIMDRMNGATPVNLAFYLSNEYSPDA